MNLKHISISFAVGFIVCGLLGAWFYISNPKIVIKKETKTETKIVYQPTNFEEAIECVNSKGEISETIDNNNVMHIIYKDKCKVADKYVSLKAYDRSRHLLIMQLANTFSKQSTLNYGGDVSYYYMYLENLGGGGGVTINNDSVTPHAGVVFSF